MWDLFCGAGGFSCGARAAGCRVAFACDSDEKAIRVHAINHPEAVHMTETLPCEIPFPRDGRRFHVHGSPPCQRFSRASAGTGNTDASVRYAELLVEWYIDNALASRATSWSMEQVAAANVLKILERKRAQNRGRLDYEVFDFSMLGVPQTRRRVIAGTPRLISKLRRQTMVKRKNKISDFIVDCRGTHIRNAKNWIEKRTTPDGTNIYTKAGWGDCTIPIDRPSPTILAKRALTWVSKSYNEVSHSVLLPCESSALQTFPPSYKFPESRAKALQLIGNAVPPFVAELMMGPEDGREANIVSNKGAREPMPVLADPGSPSFDGLLHRPLSSRPYAPCPSGNCLSYAVTSAEK